MVVWGKMVIQWGKIVIYLDFNSQWIGLRELLQEGPILNGKISGVRFRFFLKPIH